MYSCSHFVILASTCTGENGFVLKLTEFEVQHFYSCKLLFLYLEKDGTCAHNLKACSQGRARSKAPQKNCCPPPRKSKEMLYVICHNAIVCLPPPPPPNPLQCLVWLEAFTLVLILMKLCSHSKTTGYIFNTSFCPCHLTSINLSVIYNLKKILKYFIVVVDYFHIDKLPCMNNQSFNKCFFNFTFINYEIIINWILIG